MARCRKLTVSAINITMHPHKPEWYGDVIRSLHERAIITQVRGLDWGMIGTLTHHSDDSVITGTIWRFLNLDPSEPWLNLQTRSPMSGEGDEPIIPDHLKPHLRRFEFVFFTNGHRIFFDSRKASPATVQRLLLGLFSDPVISRKYGDISVVVESDHQTIDSILSIHRRAYIEIFFKKPNADDLSEIQKRMLDRMNAQNAASLDETWKGPRGGNIQPDRETIGLMEMALSNGHVKAVGYTEGEERVELDSDSHPVKKDVSYDPDEETVWEVLVDTGRKLLSKLRRRG